MGGVNHPCLDSDNEECNMTDINCVVVAGRITKDAKLAYTQGGTAKLDFSVACNRSQKKGDQWEDKCSFFDCVVWGKFAEVVAKRLAKGVAVILSGRLEQDRWKDNQGASKSKIYITVDSVQTFGGAAQKTSEVPESVQAVQQAFGGQVTSEEFPEDIPF